MSAKRLWRSASVGLGFLGAFLAGTGSFPPWFGVRRRRQAARDVGEFGVRRSKFLGIFAVLGRGFGTGGKGSVQLDVEQLRGAFLVHGGLIAANR